MTSLALACQPASWQPASASSEARVAYATASKSFAPASPRQHKREPNSREQDEVAARHAPGGSRCRGRRRAACHTCTSGSGCWRSASWPSPRGPWPVGRQGMGVERGARSEAGGGGRPARRARAGQWGTRRLGLLLRHPCCRWPAVFVLLPQEALRQGCNTQGCRRAGRASFRRRVGRRRRAAGRHHSLRHPTLKLGGLSRRTACSRPWTSVPSTVWSSRLLLDRCTSAGAAAAACCCSGCLSAGVMVALAGRRGRLAGRGALWCLLRAGRLLRLMMVALANRANGGSDPACRVPDAAERPRRTVPASGASWLPAHCLPGGRTATCCAGARVHWAVNQQAPQPAWCPSGHSRTAPSADYG